VGAGGVPPLLERRRLLTVVLALFCAVVVVGGRFWLLRRLDGLFVVGAADQHLVGAGLVGDLVARAFVEAIDHLLEGTHVKVVVGPAAGGTPRPDVGSVDCEPVLIVGGDLGGVQQTVQGSLPR